MRGSKLTPVTPRSRSASADVKAATTRRGRQPVAAGVVAGEYDGASSDRGQVNHWRHAQGYAPNVAANPHDRAILRNRCRHEAANNSYAAGIIRTLANDTVGTGPRLQIVGGDNTLNREVEQAFARFLADIDAARKLRLMRAAKVRDGGCFGVLTDNAARPTPVKLDLRLVEDERVSDAFVSSPTIGDDLWVEGIRFDASDNPVTYRVSREHPGDVRRVSGDEYDDLPASVVVHYFNADRVGQARGIPEMAPAILLFAQLRRLTLASLDAAEAAANIALAIQSKFQAADGEPEALDSFDIVDLERGLATIIPEGWELNQVRAEHPSTQYQDFKHELLNEIARCLNIPYNVAAGNSSDYNYASGRLDHQLHHRTIQIERNTLASVVLDPLLRAWLDEISARGLDVIDRAARSALPADGLPEHAWHWDGFKHVDPVKEATADLVRLQARTTTLASVYAEQGKDWDTEIDQAAREREKLVSLGLIPASGERDGSASAVAAALTASMGPDA